MNTKRTALFALCALMALAGCTRVVVKKDPGYDDEGFRYYRPKPYLFISPGSAGGGKSTFSISQGKPLEIKTSQTEKQTDILQAGFVPGENEYYVGGGEPYPVLPVAENFQTLDETKCQAREANKDRYAPKPEQISIQLMYMPDFAEEYSVELKPGLGVGELNMTLEDGWKLTTVGIKTDQQVDEILSSVAELVQAGGSLASGGVAPAGAGGRANDPCIYATNVPFGFYEAVIACDPCGRKQLYGWRYVGFMPFQSCPTQVCGMQAISCEPDCGAIYGLVWVNGILQFAKIKDIPDLPQQFSEPKPKPPGTPKSSGKIEFKAEYESDCPQNP